MTQAKTCDEEGYHSVWAAERLLVPDPPNQEWSKRSPKAFEELATLSYVAGITRRVKLGTYVLLAPFRNPLVLARQVTTLDVLSRGRVILGLGLGWMQEEFNGSGVPIADRGRRTDSVIRFLRKVWSGQRPVSFESPFTKIGPSLFEPEPVQKPIPIWIGGMTAAALRRAGARGDGWLPNAMVTPREIGRSIETISAEANKQGRSLSDIVISSRLTLRGTKEEASQVVLSIDALRELGVNLFIIDFGSESLGEVEKVRSFSRSVMKNF